MRELEIPSAEFLKWDFKQNGVEQAEFLSGQFEGDFVLKWATHGYDGKGVLRVRNTSEESLRQVQFFLAEAQKRESTVFAEKAIDFKRELAIIGVSSAKNEMTCYPLVISEQRNGICYRVRGPATRLWSG